MASNDGFCEQRCVARRLSTGKSWPGSFQESPKLQAGGGHVEDVPVLERAIGRGSVALVFREADH
jgi:hypothetical protein